MADNQLNYIRKYCDTTGIHLRQDEKDLLCKVLENSTQYNGFISSLQNKSNSGKDYRDDWGSTTSLQYKINIDSALSIDERYRHICDGYVQDEHWEWDNAWRITDLRRIIEILKDIQYEL